MSGRSSRSRSRPRDRERVVTSEKRGRSHKQRQRLDHVVSETAQSLGNRLFSAAGADDQHFEQWSGKKQE